MRKIIEVRHFNTLGQVTGTQIHSSLNAASRQLTIPEKLSINRFENVVGNDASIYHVLIHEGGLIRSSKFSGGMYDNDYTNGSRNLARAIIQIELDKFFTNTTSKNNNEQTEDKPAPKEEKATVEQPYTPTKESIASLIKDTNGAQVQETAKVADVATALTQLLNQGGISEQKVLDIMDKNFEPRIIDLFERANDTLKKRISEIEKPRTIEIKIQGEKSTKNIGTQHYQFETLLKIVQCRESVVLVGTAGSFKTSSAMKVADALGLNCNSMSVSNQTMVSQLFGYQDANGKYVKSALRDSFENGGVFILDEIDAGNANVLTALNSMLENDWCNFPDAKVNRHKDFVVIATANTYGLAADRQFVGRNQLDAATIDRFIFLDWDVDNLLEKEIATNKTWCAKIQKIRLAVETLKIRHIVSPRATLKGEKLLAVGIPEHQVLKTTVYKSLPQDKITQIEKEISKRQS